MKTKIKRHSRAVLSVILAVSMLISCMMVGLIATDAAKVKDEAVGYSNGGYVKGTWDNWATPDGSKGHDITSGYTVSLAANTTYEFVLVAKDNDDVFKKDMTITGSVSQYDFPKSATVNAKLKTTIAGNYTFEFDSWTNDTMRINITYPSAPVTADTWTVVGSATGSATGGQTDALFGSSWDPTLTANDLTNTSGTTWTWTKNNVQLSAGTIKYKVAKNHAWDTAYPAENATQSVTAGTYNVTVTYNSSNNDVTMTLTSVAKSTLTVQSNIANATVTATYNGTTAQEGGTISNVPQGAKVTISVTPDTGYNCTAVTGNPSGTATMNGSAKSWIFTMPGANTTVNATIAQVTLKKIYFNNSYTLYGSVYAYVYDDTNGTKSYEYLGAYPGTTMTKLDNSNIWYIEVPSDVDYVEFVSGEGYSTGGMKIPWVGSGEAQTYAYPKYTAPYGNNEHPTPQNGGTWGNYIYGSNNTRTNEYTVSNGSTMSASNLFTGITATLYDYYTDGEITASAGSASDTSNNSGWIGSIASDEYSKGTNASGWKWDPYKKLNSSLSAYANNTAQPKYGVTYPLYFGNLNDKDGGSGLVSSYYNFVRNANNSIDLNPNSTAITGLSGKTLANDTIHYYKSGDTNENGAPMAMFDEDFLSGENSENKALATILRTSTFPVRKTNEGGTVSSITKLHLDPTGGTWTDGNAVFDAYFWGTNLSGTWKQFSGSGTDYVVDIPTGAQNVIITRNGSHVTSFSAWNQSEDITLTLSGNSATNKVKFTGWNGNKGTFSTSLDTSLSGCTTTGGHVYYEYDSTDGKDNAYITNINKTNKTANIDYYANDAAWSGGTTNNTQGFFPFDYANKGNGAKDLGFGMKLTIPFTLNGSGANNGINTDGTAQEFKFSGDDDLWVFVDGKLVLDLGGAHARTTGSINFQTKNVTASNKQAIASGVDRNGSFADGFNTNENYVHTMTIYYMERGMFESNLQFGFSFHAIPNQFWIDKKIRTKDIINAGFYQSNGETPGTDASNQDNTLTEREGRFISKFEASYQNEAFTVTHKYGSSADGATTPASGKKYTIDNDTNTYTTPEAGTYPIKHDLGNAFIGQFDTGQFFNLKESYGSNKYVYTPVFSVWDQANNNQAINATEKNDGSYTFEFSPTTTVTTGIENTNIKARFENYMVAHSLYITKELENVTDTQTGFTLQVLFDFENDDKFIAYPLHCFVDGVRTQLSNTGTIAVKAGQTVEIDEIPENAKIKVSEVLADTVNSSYRYGGITLTKGGSTVTPTSTVTKGVVFNMGDADMRAVVTNRKQDFRYSIKYTYPSYGKSPLTDSLYGNQSYTVSGVFDDSEKSTYLNLDANGNPVFKTAEAKRIFVNNKAPYEDNFMQTLSFADSTIDETTSKGYGWSNDTYSCEVVANADTADYKISAYFDLPYSTDNDLKPQESGSSGKVQYLNEKIARGSKDVTCFDWYVTSGKTSIRDTTTQNDPVFVKAPLIVYTDVNDENTKKYFQYWSVKKHGGYGSTDVEYTRCYDYEFNFALFMDCIIEPVYGDTWAQTSNPNPPTTYDMYSRFDPELQITGDDKKGVKIAFLENSRNQYNNGDDGGRNKNPAADIIYSDFLLNFNYIAGTTKLNTLPSGTKKAGLVVEAVDYMQYEQGTANIFDYDADYSNIAKYTAKADEKKAEILSWLTGGAKPTGCAKSEFDVAAVAGNPNKGLDNKNCKQYYYSLNNRSFSSANGGQLVNDLQNRYKVFRAYAYIGDVDGTKLKNVTISDPVYFTVYDVGSQGLADNKTN